MIGLSGPPLKTGLEWQLIAGFRTGWFWVDLFSTFFHWGCRNRRKWTREWVSQCAKQIKTTDDSCAHQRCECSALASPQTNQWRLATYTSTWYCALLARLCAKKQSLESIYIYILYIQFYTVRALDSILDSYEMSCGQSFRCVVPWESASLMNLSKWQLNFEWFWGAKRFEVVRASTVRVSQEEWVVQMRGMKREWNTIDLGSRHNLLSFYLSSVAKHMQSLPLFSLLPICWIIGFLTDMSCLPFLRPKRAMNRTLQRGTQVLPSGNLSRRGLARFAGTWLHDWLMIVCCWLMLIPF